MNIINILAITPYQGMSELMEDIASKRNDINLTTYIGDLSTGLNEAYTKISSGNYHMIISRGGTAERLSQTTEVPTLDIQISLGDILQAIKLAENYQEKFAIVGFPSISNRARLICDLLDYHINVYTIYNEDADLTPLLHKLKQNGYSMIVGDMITTTYAKGMGLNSVLITSSVESIEAAFNQAVKLSQGYLKMQNQNKLLNSIIDNTPHEILVYHPDGRLIFSSLPTNEENNEIISYISSILPSILSQPDGYTEKIIETLHIEIKTATANIDNEPIHLIYITKKTLAPAHKDGSLMVLNKNDILSELSNNYYKVVGVMESTRIAIERFSQQSSPIMLIGEQGSGINSAASLLYTNGIYSQNPMYIIDCGLISDKQFCALLQKTNSPLLSIHTTLYFRHITHLSITQREQLLVFFEQSNLTSRCKLIFSHELTPDDKAYITEINNITGRLNAISLHLPPLRECKDTIPSLVALYLNQINTKLGKQIIGFNPDALEMLISYDWPYNLDQFQRVLNELAIITNTFHISAENTSTILKQEQVTHTPANAANINLNQPLNEIIDDVLRIVLQEENNNQKRTAERLGIGRSTVWRMLKSRE